jgi:hypothetical protein
MPNIGAVKSCLASTQQKESNQSRISLPNWLSNCLEWRREGKERKERKESGGRKGKK